MSTSGAIPDRSLRVQFVHGLEGSPQGRKARLFAGLFDACTPRMDTGDFEGCVAQQAEVVARFAPHILVGSSFGGAVAAVLLERGLWAGPTLLLAQAALRLRPDLRLPAGVPVWLLHGLRDEVIASGDSARLAATGDAGLVRLFEVDDDHPLSRTTSSGRLAEVVRELARAHVVHSDPPLTATDG